MASSAFAADDPYENYVKTSKDFKAVKQDAAWLRKAFPSWVYMPWTRSGRSATPMSPGSGASPTATTGAFIDWDRIDANGSKTGRLDWITKHERFYVDHLAGKRELHMWTGPFPRTSSPTSRQRRSFQSRECWRCGSGFRS
ncbi:MAG: hypothetical protein U0792_22610 [Gemmataceae bacterium]